MRVRPRDLILVALVATAAAWFAVTWQRAHAPVRRSGPATMLPPTLTPTAIPPKPAIDVERIFSEEVKPILARFEQRNREAADAAVADVRERLDGRRWGITPFVKDVNRWGTKFGVIGKTAGDFWQRHWHRNRDAASVKTYVDAKFRHHVMSEASLESDLSASLATFHEAIAASRNRLYVDLRLPLEKIRTNGGATTMPAEMADFRRRVEEQARADAGRLGKEFAGDSVAQGINTLLVTTVAAEVSHRIVAGVVTNVLTRVGTQVAARTVTAGGATAAGAAAGGGGGTLAGPAGTVVGAAVGLTVGVVIDMWMSKKFEERMTRELQGYFDTVGGHLIDGHGGDGRGLKGSLSKSVEHLNAVQREAVYRAMLETEAQ